MNRGVKERYLILCEGHTEFLYAKGIKSKLPRSVQRTINIGIETFKKSDPISLAKEAIKRQKNAKKDKTPFKDIWLFFDFDNRDNIADAFALAEKNNLKVAYSSVSIEYWFLLHFINTGRIFRDTDDIIHHLKKNWGSYKKTGIDFWGFLSLKYPVAKQNACLQRQGVISPHSKNPYTDVDLMVDWLLSLK